MDLRTYAGCSPSDLWATFRLLGDALDVVAERSLFGGVRMEKVSQFNTFHRSGLNSRGTRGRCPLGLLK
jgi:hypothetical protein